MVQMTEEDDLPLRIYKTDDDRFQIRVRGLSLERFETKLSNDKYKVDKLLRTTLIDTFLLFRTKPTDNLKGYSMADRLLAVEDFRQFLFKAYLE